MSTVVAGGVAANMASDAPPATASNRGTVGLGAVMSAV